MATAKARLWDEIRRRAKEVIRYRRAGNKVWTSRRLHELCDIVEVAPDDMPKDVGELVARAMAITRAKMERFLAKNGFVQRA